MKNKNKVFIFDFDGVFYSGKHKFDKIADMVHANKRKFLPHLSNKEYSQVQQEFPDWKNVVAGADVAACLFKMSKVHPGLNITANDFYDWQENNRYELIIDDSQVSNPQFVKELCEKFNVYIVSNSSQNHLKFYMKKFKVRFTWFKKVISNKFEFFDLTKKHYYADILAKEKCAPENVYVFGDSKKNDLVPAKTLGMNVVYITNANDVEKQINLIINQ